MEEFYKKPAIGSAFLRVLLFLVCWVILFLIAEVFGFLFIQEFFPEHTDLPYAGRVLTLVVTFLLIAIFRKYIDKRPVFRRWFSLKNRRLDFLWGSILGAVLIALGTFILSKAGYIEIYPSDISPQELVQYMLFFLIAALIEELVMRGYILDNLLEETHWFVALLISSVLFTLLHFQIFSIINPAIPVTNLFLAGFFLGITFIFNRNLWFPLGLHFTWNFFQGPVFGFNVSGIATKSMFKQDVLKESIISGGSFGFEGSILATTLIVITTILLYFIFKRITANENS